MVAVWSLDHDPATHDLAGKLVQFRRLLSDGILDGRVAVHIVKSNLQGKLHDLYLPFMRAYSVSLLSLSPSHCHVSSEAPQTLHRDLEALHRVSQNGQRCRDAKSVTRVPPRD